MNLEDFQFELPKELIAQKPASPRDSAKLLVYDRSTKKITDAIFRDINSYLDPKTTLVLNKAKVDKVRLQFGTLEIFLLETFNNTAAKAMVRPGKKFRVGDTVQLTDSITVEVQDIDEHGHRSLVFNTPLDNHIFDRHRLTPLPPYIPQDESLADEYQTVYAQDAGSKAAPTAGLHFTEALLEELGQSHTITEITLDVGLGTFAPISEEDIAKKKLHEETFTIDRDTAMQITRASHITAVGTTSVRALESFAMKGLHPIKHGSTNIFIQPGDDLRIVDSLITNFHLPSTSLLMLVAAFVGRDELMRIYRHAIDSRYRFYSFGDAMLIV